MLSRILPGSALVYVALCGVGGCYVGVPGGHGFGGATEGGSADGSATGGETADAGEDPPSGEGAAGLGPRWLSRLSRAEYASCVQDVLGVAVDQVELDAIPDADPSPFDNDAQTQSSSSALVSAYERIGRDVAAQAVSSPSLRGALEGCAGSADCVESVAAPLARRLFRRPLEPTELDAFLGLRLPSMSDGEALQIILSALLQDASFVFRVELGEAVDGEDALRRLTDVEVASRLSFLLWGMGPDDILLDAAEAGTLHSVDARLEQAARMLDDPRAVAQSQRFFALWLGYAVLPHDAALASAMQQESDALIERMWSEGAPWTAPFVAATTYLDADLAAHYQLDVEVGAEPGWVEYPDGRRGGILSHGSFLALGAKFGDTSPVVRGLEVRRRLLCLDMPPPPPELEVDVDSPPPGEAACKPELYAPMVDNEACAVCHAHLNPLGFGLEAFDQAGRFREHEEGAPQCAIEGKGELPGVGMFSGPGELGQLLADADPFLRCYATHLLRHWLARSDVEPDAPLVDVLLGDDPAALTWPELLLAFVASDAFVHRLLPDPESP